MKRRIANLVGEENSAALWMGTFHSVFARILRIEAEKLGYTSNYTIYDETDSKSLIKRIIKEMGLDEKTYKSNVVQGRISEAKNQLLLPADYSNSPHKMTRDNANRMPEIHNIYKVYNERCHQANAMDFDDILMNIYYLFKNNNEVRERWAQKFDFVLVDEYQDTNYAQHQIVLQLTRDKQKVCVVGDDAQSIYSFRGANIDNILSFNKSYDNVQTFKLERNYRSTKSIVAAANTLIKYNEKQIHKEVYSENQEGEPIVLRHTFSDREEATFVCNEIRKLRMKEGGDYSDFAVLYRTNAQSRTFEEAMRKEGMPYRIYGGLSFYQRKEIKDVIAYMKMVCNPDDEEAFKRIFNYPSRGLGDTTLNKIITCANDNHTSLWNVICNPEQTHLNLNTGTMAKVIQFRQMIENFISAQPFSDAYDMVEIIVGQSGVKEDLYSSHEVEDIARQENLEELLGSVQEFVELGREEGHDNQISLSHFLQEVSLLTDLDSDKDQTMPKVNLMTIHSAKGLEFPTVFIVGVEEDIFPSAMSLTSIRTLEEERRLFYVAITRAERHCYVTTAQTRWRYGNMEYGTPSRFIKELHLSDSSAKRTPSLNITRHATTQGLSQQRSTFKPIDIQTTHRHVSSVSSQGGDANSCPLKEGNTIEHDRFGIGTVLHIEGSGENTKATVAFRNAGTKQLLLKFARIRVIG